MQTAKRCKILVVEDEGLIAHDIAQRLENLGHEVVATVGTAAEAIENAPQAELVLMDIRLDGPTDGIEAAAEIRRRFHLPVIFLTGQADRSTIERAKLTEPFGYIVKPLAPAALPTSIEIALYRHRMERRLVESESWLRTTLASVTDAVLVTDAQSLVRMLNPAAEALTGWSQADADGVHASKILRLVEPGSGDTTEDPVPLALLRDAPVALHRTSRCLTRSGGEIEIEGTVAPVKADGASIGAAVTLRDVGQRRWEERQLRQSQKMEAAGRLAAGISNDYSNLIAVIRNQAEQLLRQFPEYSSARTAIEEIHKAAAAADAITRRLACFSTRQVTQPETLSLNGLLRRMSRLIESMATSRIKVGIQTGQGVGRIHADAAQIEQVIMNLVMHSCALTPDGGDLRIATSNTELPPLAASGHAPHAKQAYVLLAVTHSGIEVDCERIFEPGASGDDALALPMVYSIVTDHGGFVSAQSERGGGCRFEVLLPRSTEALTPAPAAGDAPAILFVDDRDSVRAELHNFFEAAGYNLLEAADAMEALALAEVHDGPLDLLICDEKQAAAIVPEIRRWHPPIELLGITDHPSRGPDEIQSPFTQQALLDRVASRFAV